MIDNVVNGMVCEENCGASREDILRVLRPNGKAWICERRQWGAITKPWPDAIDGRHGHRRRPIVFIDRRRERAVLDGELIYQIVVVGIKYQ